MDQEVLPSPLSLDVSSAGFFVAVASAALAFDARLTPLPTTPRCVTPADPLVQAVETVGGSKPPLLLAVALCEELNIFGDDEFPPLALADAIPRISERIDFGFKTSCCRSSSCNSRSPRLIMKLQCNNKLDTLRS